MAKKRIRIVQVGCGSISRTWLRAALLLPAVEVVGLVDLSRPAAEQRADSFNLSHDLIYPSLRAVLSGARPEVVFDTTVPAAHDQVTIPALRAGCHVLGEKPMTISIAKAHRMIAAAKKARRLYAVIQNRRYDANITALVRFLRASRIGRIAEIHCQYFASPHFGGFREQIPDTLLFEMGIHTFDAARFITGADPLNVYCHSSNPKHTWYKGNASASAIFEMTGGMVYTYCASWCAHGLMTSWNSRWRIIGSKGTVEWNGETGFAAEVLAGARPKGLWAPVKSVRVPVRQMKRTGHEAIIREFIDCVRSGKTPQTYCTDNVKSLAMILSAIRSSRTGRRVAVQW